MLRCLITLAGLWAGVAFSAGTPGRFDYYLLALSWSPQYCATAKNPDASQCASARAYGFVVHGLWPQYERGYPSDCATGAQPGPALIERLLPIMPSRGLIRHEWRKHGSCSGLGSEGYFAAVERSYRSIRIPERYRTPQQAMNLAPAEIEADFIAANRGFDGHGIALECRGRYLAEVRLCLDRDLRPRACGTDLRDRCGDTALLRAVRQRPQ